MNIPSNMSYGTVTGRFLLAYADGPDSGQEPDAVPAQGSIYFSPSAKMIKNSAASPAPAIILPAVVHGTLDSNGYLIGPDGQAGIRLTATDDPSGNPVDWTWSVSFQLTDADGTPVKVPSFSIELPSNSTVDLANAAPVQDANGTYYLVGPTGPANSLSIGTVTTGAAGSSASATITGNAPSQTLSLTIPKGDTGNAATIAVGTVTTGAAGSSASVTNTGTSYAATFDFTIPRGDKGEQGIQGNTGLQGLPGIVSSSTAPTNTSVVWLDTSASAVAPSATANYIFQPTSGQWITSLGIGGQASAGTINSLYMYPIVLNTTTTFNSMGVYVSAGQAGTTVRLGIYGHDGTNKPGNLILDAGAVDSSTVGFKSVVINQTLAPGIYWIGQVSQGGTTQPGLYGSSYPLTVIPITATTPSSYVSQVGWVTTGISGTLPSSIASWGPTYAGSVQNGVVKLKVQ